MKTNPNRIDEQAAEYFARRRGAALSERKARDAWLNEDPRNAKAYEDLQKIWDSVGVLADDPQLHALKTADLARASSRPGAYSRKMFAIAATLFLFVGAGYISTRRTQPPQPEVFATALGEHRTESMQDGTSIVLNTNSLVEVRYSKRLRKVDLRKGEAQFEVAHDAARPFVVTVGIDKVTALGTRFQVRRDLHSSTVTLLEGSVEVARGDERYILRPNERAVLSAGIAIASIDPELANGWLDGWLRFRGAPLAEVIAEANRYSDQRLRLGDPRLAGIELSGNFHAGDNASLADAASQILPVRVERRGSEIVLLPKEGEVERR